MSTSELASSYAALILADDGLEITVSVSNRARARTHILAVDVQRLPTPSDIFCDTCRNTPLLTRSMYRPTSLCP